MTHKVIDDRESEPVFFGTQQECLNFMNENYDEEHEDFSHIWLIQSV